MADGLTAVWKRQLCIEGGVYFLLFFGPFAFGAVEAWALGVVQIVCGAIFVAWAWDLRPGVSRVLTGPPFPRPARAERVIWWTGAAFGLLVVIQLVPLPGPVLRWVAPGSYDLYRNTLPGFDEGRPFDPAALAPWLLKTTAKSAPAAEPPVETALGGVPTLAAATTAGSWRTVSIYPYETRARLALLLAYAGLFAAITGTFQRREQLSRLFRVAVGSAFAVSLLGILQKLSGAEQLYWLREGYYSGIFGPFVNRNSYAAFAGTVLPLALCLALRASKRRSADDPSALPRLLVFSFAAVVVAGGIFYSLSRGGMIAAVLSIMLVAGLLVLMGHRPVELLSLALIVVVAGSFVLWVGSGEVVERVETLGQGSGAPTLAARFVAWDRAVEMLGDHLVLGSGLGTFRFSNLRYSPPGHAWWTTAHNEYIEILCDTGLVGGLLVLVALSAYIYRVWTPRIFRRHGRAYAWAGLVAGIAGLLLHSGVSSNLQVPANALLLVAMAAGLLNLVRLQEAKQPAHRRRSRTRPSTPAVAP